VQKASWFVKFSGGSADGDARWERDHGPLVLKVPGLRRYVQNRVVTSATLRGKSDHEPAFDGIATMWFDDSAALRAALASAEWKRVLEDSATLFEADWTLRGMNAEMEERVQRVGLGAVDDGVSTPPRGPVKVIGLLKYRPDMTREEANQWWIGPHTKFALKIRQMGHYHQNHAIRPIEGDMELKFDGYSEAWFADQATYEAGMASAEWRALNEDGPNLFDMGVFDSAIVEERVLLG
jgi:uncharacterized protein (TIGR02118 family)